MPRLRYNGLVAALGAALTTSGTTITFAAALTHSNGVAVPTLAGDYIPLTILDSNGNLAEIIWLTAYTAGATTGTIVRGQEATAGVTHASGDQVVQAPTALDVQMQAVGDVAVATNTGAADTALGTSYGAITGLADLTIPAVAGDLVRLSYQGILAATGSTPYAFVDFQTIVAGSPVNYASSNGSGGSGIAAAYTSPQNIIQSHGGEQYYVVQSGDLSNGTVTFRCVAKVSTGTRTIVGGGMAQISAKVMKGGGAQEFACRLVSTAGQSIPDSAATAVNFGTEVYDPQGMHDLSTNPNRITIPAGGGGKYLIEGAAGFVGNTTNGRYIQIRKNGSNVTDYGAGVGSGGAFNTPSAMVVIDADPGDYFDLSVYQNSGGALALISSGLNTHFSATRLSPAPSQVLGGILAATSHNPGTIAPYTTSGTTDGDIDATNLAATFTAPASGAVLVALAAVGGYDSGGGGGYMVWTIREGSTTRNFIQVTSVSSSSTNSVLTAMMKVTGLTPGQSYTFKWGWYNGPGGGAPVSRIYAGGIAGPATMKVEVCPA